MIELANTVARVSLRFGRVMRATVDEDGAPESGTTHSVMLAMLACEIAVANPLLRLDTGLLCEMAICHDVAEVYAGGTNTMGGLSREASRAKAAREREALEELQRDGLRWAPAEAGVYEVQVIPEARFLRYLDKILPKLTHLRSGCAVPLRVGRSREDLEREHRAQGDALRETYPEWASTLGPLFDAACKACEELMPARNDSKGQDQ
jgi:5'-deoxynucleotidase YfbR-like HD superfamily hydrolase